ncbi:MAG: biotin/lipoyl-binding protein [Bacteroidales bacterium]|nr:biotin/lipoyl-binding protein [Bacteroidales bacterium]MCF8387601.1 biotin/lipoyl-binding protein [Bacteroidales bacterium]MCF8397593.1 biotin/lipoyl-binding protein [Bacteroidales bacterium]
MKNFKFTIRGHVYEVDILSFEDSQAMIEVNGTPYEVEVHKTKAESKTPVLVRKEVKHPKDSHKIKKQDAGTLKVKAPLPGNIMQVIVRAGDEVKKNDKLLIYEAMKMENNLLAEKGGKIKKVHVNPGDSVLEGDLLIEIE